ncbi:ABC transporter substrate-binding protein [Pedobacter alpinus]|uniref:ABC transporter substrate-binding protein n=1 Tax=Pedobacter alpinus TaxID=1590643 RepID=A0ABW5TW44_9SPHI
MKLSRLSPFHTNYSPLSIQIKPIYFLLLPFYFITACSPKTTPVNKQPEFPKVEQKVVVKEVPKQQEVPVQKAKDKSEMIVSLILPFELSSIDYKTATLSDIRKAEIAIDFYQGFKMGLDSVAATKGAVNFKLQVFDSNDNPASLGTLASKGAIKVSDLIVGPVFPNGVKAFSAYSKNMKKPMVSPLAATDPETFNNPYLITVNNAIDQHAFKAVTFIKTELKPKKVIIIRSGQADEYKYAVPFKKGVDSLAKGMLLSEIGIKAIGYENVYKYLNPTGLNVIVLPATDRVFLLTIFKELEKLSRTFKIAVIGHPGWKKAAFLDFQQLELLNTYITSSYKINYQTSQVLDFIKYYRSNFSVEPSEYAFKGFDIGYYFGLLMNEKEHDFMKAIGTSFNGIHNDFNFIQNSKYGYFNTSLMVMKYENSQLTKVN